MKALVERLRRLGIFVARIVLVVIPMMALGLFCGWFTHPIFGAFCALLMAPVGWELSGKLSKRLQNRGES